MLGRLKLSGEAQPVLVSLGSGPKHGYAIAEDIERFAARRLGPRTLYGAIARLEVSGCIEAVAGEARRRPYRLTTGGIKTLRASLAESDRISAVARRRLAPR
jgi:DNA-binding PadR family transcriptional regulator